MTSRTGGRVLVDSLLVHGVDRVFCVPGESYLAVLDALQDKPSIDVVVSRHEGAAAYMAEADARLTGRPGVCFVTRGPGATHASIGVHMAREDSTPLVLFIGQVERGFVDREAFQEIDYRQMFAGLAKWVAQIDDAARIPEYVLRAFQIATSGRPGPVVLALPEDMLDTAVHVADTKPYQAVQSAPGAESLAALGSELERASRPLVIVGGSGWTADACADLAAWATRLGLPVATSFRRQDLFDNDHANYAGHVGLGIDPALAASVRGADLLLVIGSRLGEATTNGYSLIAAPQPTERLVHVHTDPAELGRVYRADVLINATMPAMASALRAHVPTAKPEWRPWTDRLHRDAERFREVPPASCEYRGVHLDSVVAQLSAVLPPDAIVCNGAGNYSTMWVHRFHRYRRFGTELAPVGGAMGYGVPAAIAANLRHPDRVVVCYTGDGCFLMYPQELATAVQYGAAIVIVLVNNGMYGAIRMHQERRHPGRTAYTDLVNPDFVALARSFGAYGEQVSATGDFAGAFARARAAGVPALLDVRVDPAQITPAMRIAEKIGTV